MASGSEYGCGRGGSPGAGDRPGYGYEALSAASDGSEFEPDEAPDYAAFDTEMSGGAESYDGPSPRGSAKVNFPPEVERRRSTSASFQRVRGRSMSAWSDISRSSFRFEERSAVFFLLFFENSFYYVNKFLVNRESNGFGAGRQSCEIILQDNIL